MKHFHICRLFVVFLIAAKAMAIGVGDYVDYSEHQYPEYGTVVAISGDRKLTVRPHRAQGDFQADARELRLIKSAAEIAVLNPKPGEYTINLMWVKDFDDRGPYIFRERELDENLTRVVDWARKNSGEKVVVWYDGNTVIPEAVQNTEDVLVRDFPENARQVVFKDLSIFPEVRDNHVVFSDRTPLYFRVDLLRVVSAYHTLTNEAALGKRHYFVYADLDVTPMSKSQLFDASTQMDLDTYGIVMARGGLNVYNFENSFQIWSNNKPNLLKAAKNAIIDVNILRAHYIISGGYWSYKQPGDTKPLEQKIYDSYAPMFLFFYRLEKWGTLRGESSDDRIYIPSSLNREAIKEIFGLQDINVLSLKIDYRELQFHEETFWRSDGRKWKRDTLYIPRKIIEAPSSKFGGRPTSFNPGEVTPRNYKQKLDEALNKPLFDNYLLLIAARNDDVSSAIKIINHLSPQQLADAALTASEEQAYDPYESIPLLAAFKYHPHIASTILEKWNEYPKLIERAARVLGEGDQNDFLPELIKDDDIDGVRNFYRIFSSSPESLALIANGLLNSQKKMYRVMFAKPEMLELLRQTFLKDSQALALVLLKKNQYGDRHINVAFERGDLASVEALAGDLLKNRDFLTQWGQALKADEGEKKPHALERDSAVKNAVSDLLKALGKSEL